MPTIETGSRHLLDARHSDPITNTRKTLCGLVGRRGVFNDQLVAAGVIYLTCHTAAYSTCGDCRKKLGKPSAPMVKMLRKIRDTGTWLNSNPDNGLATHRALIRLGLVNHGSITQHGAAAIADADAAEKEEHHGTNGTRKSARARGERALRRPLARPARKRPSGKARHN